jgi:hypothetical protein
LQTGRVPPVGFKQLEASGRPLAAREDRDLVAGLP